MDLAQNALGDVLNDGAHQYLYDAEGRTCAVYTNPVAGISTMTGYLYDADGTRIAKGSITAWSCDPAQNGFQTTNDYILGLGGEQLTEMGMGGTVPSGATTTGLVWQHANIWSGGKLLGTYDNDGLHFYLDDPLGTRRAQTNFAGVLEQTCQSLPYGDALTCVSARHWRQPLPLHRLPHRPHRTPLHRQRTRCRVGERLLRSAILLQLDGPLDITRLEHQGRAGAVRQAG